MAEVLSQVLNDNISELPELVSNTTEYLENLSVDDILEKCNNEAVISKDSIPYENVRNNNKIFLIYFAKKQLQRVVKLSGYLETLEDQLMMEAPRIKDPDTLMRMIGTIQSSMMTAINLIDRVSTDDSYVKFVFNDNRKIINNLNQTTINASTNINLSKESREKLRGLAESLLTEVNTAIENGGEFSENK